MTCRIAERYQYFRLSSSPQIQIAGYHKYGGNGFLPRCVEDCLAVLCHIQMLLFFVITTVNGSNITYEMKVIEM